MAIKARQMAHSHICQRCNATTDMGEFVGAEADYFWCKACLAAFERSYQMSLTERRRVIRRAAGLEME